MAAKKILVDLEKLAYVPASLKISKAPKGSTHPCPEAAKGMSDAVGGPEGEALQQAAAHAASQPARPDAEGVPLADAGILKSSTKPKKTKSAHPVVIAQDELDGLLSSLLKEPDNDRS